MINSSNSGNNSVKQRLRKVAIGTVALIFVVGISVGIYFIFSNGEGKINTQKTQEQIRSGEPMLTLGDYEICNWKLIEFDTHIPLTIDGKDEGFFDGEDDMLIKGFLCGTDQEVLLASDEQGLHGSILDSDNVVRITAVDEVSSTLSISDQEFPTFTQSEKVEAADKKWKEYIASRQNDRRAMNALESGSIDIHIHLDIDSHMVEEFGSAFAAARYGVELIAVVNRDAYIDLGFNLKVVSINVRSSYLSSTSNAGAYLSELEKIPRPFNVNLLHSLSTRDLGGGIAYLGGLYTSNSCYGVSGVYGDFHLWDRYVVAHELGHNFGADHTHEMSPPVDTCGLSCPSDPSGTIMSYCHLCSGGLSNLRYEWHERVREVILNDYALENGNLATRYGCQNFPAYPDVGVPFTLQGDACLTIDSSACAECAVETCSIDSSFQFTGTQVKASQDSNYCWTASNNCDSISLQLCDDSSNQRFFFEDSSLKSETCGQVKHQGGSANFDGSLVSTWCSPDENPSAGPSCDQTIIALGCGDTHIGSTIDDCDGQRRFTFVAPNGPVTVSSCGSAFDTVLSVETADSRLYYSDDDGNCNSRAELLNMVNLSEGEEYTIVLQGYASAKGDYNLAITCSDDSLTTNSPTDDSLTTNSPTDDSLTTNAPTDPLTTFSPTDGQCESSVIELQCGIAQTGSTVNTCDAQQRFVFTATTNVKTISACGSQYDTVMSIYDSKDEWLGSNDDSNECGLDSIISNVALNIGSQYMVILGGYSDQVGEYTIELTCQSDESLTPTLEPTVKSETDAPSARPTGAPNLSSTNWPTSSAPTLQPTTSAPTPFPTSVPGTGSLTPTLEPTVKSETDAPSAQPTGAPTLQPTTSAPTPMPTSVPGTGCDATVIDIACDETLTGSTIGSCDAQQIFRFTASTSMKTISACGSQYDTKLSVYNVADELVFYQDDSNECGLQSFVEDLSLEIGTEYFIVLHGYNDQVGNYALELTCQSDDASSTPTLEPTAPLVETLSPTLDPTMDPTFPLVETLTPTLEPTPPTCDSTIINIACGQTLTGSTANSCDAQQQFTFTATTSMKSISTCGSQYDTMLDIYSANGELIFYQDDSSECSLQSFIKDLPVEIGVDYIIVLRGYSNQVGTYNLELTCESDESATVAPTVGPTVQPQGFESDAPTQGPTSVPGTACDSTIIDVACGQTLTGSTADSCDAEQRFTFTATTSMKSISTCGSEYDTMLDIYSANDELVYHQDDSTECSLQSFIEDLSVEIGMDYTIVLRGYANQVGTYNLELTCDSSPEPECDDTIQTLTCGDVVTQSTIDTCLGEQTFQFTATSGLTTISSCGSEFDTMLEVVSDNGFSRSNDDSHICGYHSVISDMALQEGENYFVTLSGWSGNRGNYRLELTCDTTTLSPTSSPTEPAQVTYTRIRDGKCQTLDGSDPLHEYHGNTPECEQLCTQRADCYGYSLSRYSNCLLWTQSDLMGGGAPWGRADCHIKN